MYLDMEFQNVTILKPTIAKRICTSSHYHRKCKKLGIVYNIGTLFTIVCWSQKNSPAIYVYVVPLFCLHK